MRTLLEIAKATTTTTKAKWKVVETKAKLLHDAHEWEQRAEEALSTCESLLRECDKRVEARESKAEVDLTQETIKWEAQVAAA